MSKYQILSEFLHEKMKEHGVNIKQLSDASGITKDHLEHLIEGEADLLPPAPYLRGYLRKLGDILDFDGDEWWDVLKKEGEASRSGPEDRLPENRFTERPVNRYVWFGGILLVAILYILLRLPEILGNPGLVILSPQESFYETSTSSIVISGRLEHTGTVSINREAVTVEQDGTWEKQISLQEGINTIDIRAKKFLGKETETVKQILYTPAPAQNLGSDLQN